MNGGDAVIRARAVGKRYRIATERVAATNVTEALRATWSSFGRRITLRGGTAGKRDFWALRNVSFAVEPGEVLAIVGANGAGKSTMLKILSRITDPTEGVVEIRGRVSSLLEVGTGFHPELSGRDNVYLNGAILGMKRAEISKKFNEIVDFSGVREFIDVPVKRYSSGMYVRLAFAVAAHLEPEILLVDEVLAVGDREFQDRSLGRIGDVARAGRTVIFVSHDMGAVANLCTRGIVLERGQVVFDGPITQAVETYLGSRPRLHSTGSLAAAERQGTGEARFREVTVAGEDGRPHVYPDRPVLITVEFAAPHPLPGRHVELALEVSSALGERLATLRSRFDETEQLRRTVIEDGTQLTCRIAELPLKSGKYLLGLRLERSGELLDEVEGQIDFDVYPSDYYGTGAVPGEKDGPLLVRHEWLVAAPASVPVDA